MLKKTSKNLRVFSKKIADLLAKPEILRVISKNLKHQLKDKKTLLLKENKQGYKNKEVCQTKPHKILQILKILKDKI